MSEPTTATEVRIQEDARREELKGKFARYEEAKLKIKELEAVVDELKPDLLAAMPDDKNLALEKGYFYVQKKPKWTYTEATQAEDKRLKELKKEEEAKGFATVEYSKVLIYKEGSPE